MTSSTIIISITSSPVVFEFQCKVLYVHSTNIIHPLSPRCKPLWEKGISLCQCKKPHSGRPVAPDGQFTWWESERRGCTGPGKHLSLTTLHPTAPPPVEDSEWRSGPGQGFISQSPQTTFKRRPPPPSKNSKEDQSDY